ncbi:hypothetical protein E2C01_024838 [Portunus trituberculatus]|uniref:Uncharacterized protein n=1 Tax=Portunus trituberculatus TaxID=210409 RepID=A0A5B7EDW0_PORTR|nr:hypothetical protein [Portunus trituberculatus]
MIESTVNACIKELDSIGVRGRGKPSAARPKEEGKYAVTKISRAVSMKNSDKR